MNIIINDALQLESNHISQAEENYLLICNNRPYLKQWLTWVDRIQTLEEFKNFINISIIKAEQQTDYPFVIKLNGKIIGRIGIHFIDNQHKIGSIGYWISEGFQGQGVINQSCKAIIKFAFTDLGINRIEIKCAVKNLKSKAIPEKLNFKQEGVLRQAEFINGNFHDLYLYSMLRDEWVSGL